MNAEQIDKLLSSQKGFPKAVVVHWTAGASKASSIDRQHYHFMVEGDGTIVQGVHTIQDNDVVGDNDYAAHCRGFNTRTIGVSLCGMAGAQESPFKAGRFPINEKQFRVLCLLVARICKRYAIPVTSTRVLTHAEVQPNLGIRQRGKWDITRIPWAPGLVGAKACGDYLRSTIIDSLTEQTSGINKSQIRQVHFEGKKLIDGVLEDGETLVAAAEFFQALRKQGVDITSIVPGTDTPGMEEKVQVKYSSQSSSIPATWIAGTAYVPIRDVTGVMQWAISYDPKSRTVTISPDID